MPTRTKLTFEQWMRQVDEACQSQSGLSIHDLPDCPFHDWYDSGTRPASAARKAIKMAMDE